MKMTHTMHPQQTGLTLIEILVAMVISLILMAGVLQIFQANRQSFRVQESLSLIQENGRTAMRILAEDLRIATFWGCRSQDVTSIKNNLNPAGAGYVDLLANGGIAGTNNDGLNASDSITINGARSDGFALSSPIGDPSNDIPVTNGNGIQPGDVMLITNCERGEFFQVTNAAPLGPADLIEHAAGGPMPPGNSTDDLSFGRYETEAVVFPTRQTTYAIAADPDSNEPSLIRTEGAAETLVEGIEDMQIAYGQLIDDGNGDMRYVPADAAGLDMRQVRSVRITLTARSIASNVAVGGDGHLRRTFSNTISIRNRNP
ncbi:hypothetical protein MNBD_GAMMA19-722 [hydrothermal vent metagenome]|uniref:Type IV fimbrial biogenesis protein PilW n=1 Tax=hydrothermal vent metagenome TaxID=652676 RepID=A0A3B0ZTR1_9ZZZZ